MREDPGRRTISIPIDPRLYPRAVVERTVYDFLDRCHVRIRDADGHLEVHLTEKPQTENDPLLEAEFLCALVDHRVRTRVADETRGVREVILAAALRGAGLALPGDNANRDVRDEQPAD